jgi:predicted DCC family thiol-disulfide oxidoreductase YuxK
MPWPLLWGFVLVPAAIRDFLYDVVATHRYGIFGRRDACRLPTADERTRFLT